MPQEWSELPQGSLCILVLREDQAGKTSPTQWSLQVLRADSSDIYSAS